MRIGSSASILGPMAESTPAPLRRLIDVVLDGDVRTLGDMAAGAHLSPFHFSRQVSAGTGEAPATLRRRVVLEQAAWRLQHGWTVTDTAFAADHDSVEGFSRAFRRAYVHPPTQM